MLPIESSMEELLASEASELRGLHFEGPPPLRWVEVVVAERWNEVLRSGWKVRQSRSQSSLMDCGGGGGRAGEEQGLKREGRDRLQARSS